MMADLTTEYLGLKLRNPIIVGSSGLTAAAAGVREAALAGAGAVVLKSIFEEEIALEHEEAMAGAVRRGASREAWEYYDYELRGRTLAQYADLIREARSEAGIPVIASVNCSWSHEWTQYARAIEDAGADALELNMYFLPSDLARSSEERELAYFSVVERVRTAVRIPIALKISPYFTSLGRVIQRLSRSGVQGLVLFNRFASLDFDLEKVTLAAGSPLSTSAELGTSLRWVALMANRVSCDLCASTGVTDGAAVVKQVLAGARAVEVVSAFYRGGLGHVRRMLADVEQWMAAHDYSTVAGFRGRLSQAASEDPAAFERVQFLKRYGG